MGDERNQSAELTKATAEANATFAKLGSLIDKSIKEGVAEIDLLAHAKAAGIQLDEAVLKELKVDRFILCHPWLPWYYWYPWRPIWCWWWSHYYPWYHRCCPWWWYRCHWYPFPL
jgi:hypothetical protein